MAAVHVSRLPSGGEAPRVEGSPASEDEAPVMSWETATNRYPRAADVRTGTREPLVCGKEPQVSCKQVPAKLDPSFRRNGLETPATGKTFSIHGRINGGLSTTRRPRGRLLRLGRAKRVSQGQEEEDEDEEEDEEHEAKAASPKLQASPELRGATAVQVLRTSSSPDTIQGIERERDAAATTGAENKENQVISVHTPHNRPAMNKKHDLELMLSKLRPQGSSAPRRLPLSDKKQIPLAAPQPLPDAEHDEAVKSGEPTNQKDDPSHASEALDGRHVKWRDFESLPAVSPMVNAGKSSRPETSYHAMQTPVPLPKMAALTPKTVHTPAYATDPPAPEVADPVVVDGGGLPTTTPQRTRASRKDTVTVNGLVYNKLSVIGKGGSSKVYRVMSPANSRIFAVKKVSFDRADAATISGYKNEIDLLKRLAGHERIITLFDSEINDRKGYLVMLMECGEIDLAHMLQKRNGQAINLNFVRFYWEQMLQAVQAVHDQNIVHSDLKPANFLLVEGSLKLIDFGIAKAIGNDTTNIHRDTQVGTVNYMSPEALMETSSPCPTGSGQQQHVVKLGRPSDVWSLGCILYQMVYAKTPFSHLSMMQKITYIPNDKYPISFPSTAPITPGGDADTGAGAFEVDGDLLRVMKLCLLRDQRQRPTIPALLRDPFLHPHEKKRSVFMSGEPTAAVTVSQLRVLMERVAEHARHAPRAHMAQEQLYLLAQDTFDKLRMEH